MIKRNRRVVRYWPVLFAPLFGLGITLVVSNYIYQSEHQELQAEFDESFSNRAMHLELLLNSHQLMLESLRSLFLSSDRVTADEFHRFVEAYGQQYRDTAHLSWLEEEGGRFLVRYHQPRSGTHNLDRVNIGAIPGLRLPLEQALASNEPQQVLNPGYGWSILGNPDLLVLMPASSPPNGVEPHSGIIMGSYHFASLMRIAYEALPVAGINTDVFYVGEADAPRYLFSQRSRSLAGEFQALALSGQEWGRRPIHFLGIAWQLRGTPTPFFLDARRDSDLLFGLFGGVIATLLLTLYLYQQAIQRTRIDELVERKTQETNAINLSLKYEMEQHTRANMESKRLQQMLSNTIDSMPSIIIGIDQNNRITQWNREAEQSTGRHRNEVTDEPLGTILPQLIPLLPEIMTAVETGRVVKQKSFPLDLGNGQKVTELVIYPLLSTLDKGAVIRIDDITRQLQFQEAMLQSEKLASIGSLAAGMAHEVNNPLAGILQNTQVIQQRLSTEVANNRKIALATGTTIETIHEYLNQRSIPDMLQAIHQAGSRAAYIVREMLDFSRKESDKQEVCDIPMLLDRTLELARNDYELKKQYRIRDIDVVRDYSSTTPQVHCDPNKIQQVVLNLLRNSVHALAESHPSASGARLSLRCYPEGDEVVIEVQDNGPGIPAENLKQVFEPFFTTKEKGKGTGLGLALSSFIINKQHAGSLSAESPASGGALFRITLPQASDAGLGG